MAERPVEDVPIAAEDINDGDFFGVLRLDGLDPMLAWAMGAHTGALRAYPSLNLPHSYCVLPLACQTHTSPRPAPRPHHCGPPLRRRAIHLRKHHRFRLLADAAHPAHAVRAGGSLKYMTVFVPLPMTPKMRCRSLYSSALLLLMGNTRCSGSSRPSTLHSTLFTCPSRMLRAHGRRWECAASNYITIVVLVLPANRKLVSTIRFNSTAAQEWFLNVADGQPCRCMYCAQGDNLL